MEITLALGQMDVVWAQPADNVAAARQLAVRAAEAGADLLLLPELWATGYDLPHASRYAAPISEPPFAEMATLARQHTCGSVALCWSPTPTARPTTRWRYSIPAASWPNGIARSISSPPWRKPSTYRPATGQWWLTCRGVPPASPPATTSASPSSGVGWGPGRPVVLIAAEWPERRVEHWRLLLQARAIENQCVVAGCNRSGTGADGTFGGYSGIIDPWGRIVAEAGPIRTCWLPAWIWRKWTHSLPLSVLLRSPSRPVWLMAQPRSPAASSSERRSASVSIV